MWKNKMKGSVLAAGVAAAVLMTGCQSNAGSNRAETEALQEQIAQLEQQIAALEQQQSAAGSDSASNENAPAEDDGSAQTGNVSDDDATADEVGGNRHVSGHDEGDYHNQSHYAGNDSVSDQQGNSTDELTTYTMDELSAMVDAFVAKAVEAEPGGQAAQDMELFFALKQEEKQIDHALDNHEDELEYLYKKGSLTREEYKQLDHKLELLEDQLDDIEDQLEYVFGIED